MLVVGLMLALAGCTWKGEGLIESTPLGPRLMTSTGRHFKLVHGPADAALPGLDGYRVLIRGRRVLGTLSVREWEVPEGVSGMPVFIGTLERRGVQLGLTDHNSGAFVLFDSASWEELGEFVGQTLAVEGYVDGPHRVHVLVFEVL